MKKSNSFLAISHRKLRTLHYKYYTEARIGKKSQSLVSASRLIRLIIIVENYYIEWLNIENFYCVKSMDENIKFSEFTLFIGSIRSQNYSFLLL